MLLPEEVKLLTSEGWKKVKDCIGDAVVGIPYADIFTPTPITLGISGTGITPEYYSLYIEAHEAPPYSLIAIPPLCKVGANLAPNSNVLFSVIPIKPFYTKPQPSVFLSNIESSLAVPNIGMVNIRAPIFPKNYKTITETCKEYMEDIEGIRYFVDWFRRLYLNPLEELPTELNTLPSNWVLKVDTSTNLIKAMIEGTRLRSPNWEYEILPYDKFSNIIIYKCKMNAWIKQYIHILRNLALLATLPFYYDDEAIYCSWFTILSDALDKKLPINLGELIGTKRRYYRLFRDLNETPKNEFLKFIWESTAFYKHDNRKALVLTKLQDPLRASWPVIHKLVFEQHRFGLYWDAPFLNFKFIASTVETNWFHIHSAIPALLYVLYPNGIILLVSTIS